MDALAGSQGGAQMERLFTILDLPGPLDDHISGYFEKVRNWVVAGCLCGSVC